LELKLDEKIAELDELSLENIKSIAENIFNMSQEYDKLLDSVSELRGWVK